MLNLDNVVEFVRLNESQLAPKSSLTLSEAIEKVSVSNGSCDVRKDG
jgi:hypothetical protein